MKVYNLTMSLTKTLTFDCLSFQLADSHGLGVVYGSVSYSESGGYALLETAIDKLLASVAEQDARVLWTMRYTQVGRAGVMVDPAEALRTSSPSDNVICFPPPSLDHAFDDSLLDVVKETWKAVMGEEAIDAEFMNFEDRETHDE